MKTFTEITHTVQSTIKMFEGIIAEEHAKLFENNGRDMARNLSWKHESLIKVSERLRWLDEIATQLERVCLESVEEDITDEGRGGDEWFDERLDRLTRQILHCVIDKVWRGVDSSSNAMTIITSRLEIDAAKATVELLTGQCYSLFSWESVNDLMDGIKKRRIEQEEAYKSIIKKVELVKGSDGYSAIALNHHDKVLKRTSIKATRKKEARSECDGWARQLQENQKGWSIIVVGV